ncbi:MAG: hypothetical protein ABIO67_02360 [Mycobacteriales bacterium]
MRRRRALAALFVVALFALAGALLMQQSRPEVPRDPAVALVAAKVACAQVARFEALVDANASADRVREVLGMAVQGAREAADRDQRWVALLGGLQSLQVALDKDDPRAARVGIDVVRAECSAATPAPG